MTATLVNRIARLPNWALWLGAVVYWCALLLALHYPKIPGASQAPPGTDKVVHWLIYGVLAGLLRLLIARQTSPAGALRTAWRRNLLALGLVLLQALLDEWTQPLTGRHMDLLDLVSDVVGAICFLAAYHYFVVRRVGQSPNPTPAHVF